MGALRATKSFMEWREEWYDKWHINVYIDIDDMHSGFEDITAKQRADMEKHIDAMYKEFPQLKEMHMTFDMQDKLEETENGIPGAQYEMSSVDFTDKLFDKSAWDKTLQKQWYAGVLTSFHPQGTNNYSQIDHELAHAVTDYALRKVYKNPKYSEWLAGYNEAYRKLSDSICNIAAKKLGNEHDQLASHISHYATYDTRETIAEAVADYMANKSKANPYSIEIVKELKKRL